MNIQKAVIVSDDLTGATNSGSYFCEDGNAVCVVIDSKYLEQDLYHDYFKKFPVLAVSTNTRGSTLIKAQKKLSSLGKTIRKLSINLILKKIDTAFRGNIFIELESLLKSVNINLCFIINAIPSLKRITVGGYQIIDGNLIEDSYYAEDPQSKILTSFIPDILGKNLNTDISLITINNIRKGMLNIRRLVDEIYNNFKAKIIVFDSVSKSDIYNILISLKGYKEKAIFCGSLGLVESIREVFFRDYIFNKKNIKSFNNYFNKKEQFIVGFCGSNYDINLLQLRKAEKVKQIELVEVDVEKMLDKNFNINFAEVKDFVQNIQRILKRKNIFFIKKVRKDFNTKNLEKKIIGILDTIARELFINSKFLPRRLVLIGGETSFAVLTVLNTKTLLITERIEQAVDFGIISDGELTGVEIAIKGGSIGNADTIINMISYKSKNRKS
jgi:uncharacterized protein YgbK (DUF1537 family)